MGTPGQIDEFTSEVDSALDGAGFAEDPHPLFDRLRGRDPIHWSPSWGMWLATRHTDVESIQRDPIGFSNVGRVEARLRSFTTRERSELTRFRAHFASGLIDSDPPAHTRLRSIVVRAFTPRVVNALRPRVSALTDEFLSPHLVRGRIDVIRDFAYPLPATIIAEFLGIAAEDRDQFKDWADLITRFYGAHGEDRLSAARAGQAAVAEAREWISRLANARRREPRDDLLSVLVQADGDGSISSDELLAICVTLLVAGHETTTALISVGMLSLLEHPLELERLRQDPGLWRPGLEELIRYVSPEQRTTRVAVSDVHLGGQRIRAGDLVALLLGAANRDPEVFPTPDRLMVDRTPNPHLGFGMGIHFCAGAGLARLEASVALLALANLPRLRLHEPPRWQAGTNTRALESLVLEFDPQPARANRHASLAGM